MSLADNTRLLQRFAGVTADGKFGPVTAAALVDKLKLRPESETYQPFVSERSARVIATLLPQVQILAQNLIFDAAANGIRIEVISGTRSYAEQDALYAKGRTAPGPKVTNARSGYSNHNFGIAFDIGVFDSDGKYLGESPSYRVVGALGKSLGLDWGGDWKTFRDEPHFQLRPAWAEDMNELVMLSELRARKAAGRDVFS